MENTITLKGPVEYIKDARNIYFKKENMVFFVKLLFIVVLVSVPLSNLAGNMLNNYSDYSVDGFATLGISIVSLIIAFWMQTIIYFSLIDMGNNQFEILKKSFKKTPLFVGVSMILMLITIVGLILLVVPAIIFGLWYSFVLFLILDKGMKLKEAMATSKSMVKGKMMKVFGRFLVFGLFSFTVSGLLSIIPYLGSIVSGLFAPLFLLPSYLLYKDLSANLN